MFFANCLAYDLTCFYYIFMPLFMSYTAEMCSFSLIRGGLAIAHQATNLAKCVSSFFTRLSTQSGFLMMHSSSPLRVSVVYRNIVTYVVRNVVTPKSQRCMTGTWTPNPLMRGEVVNHWEITFFTRYHFCWSCIPAICINPIPSNLGG